MTKTLAPAKLSITTTKTSLNSTQPRYTSSLLATQRSSTTNTSSSIRNGSARLQNTSRLPAAVHGSAGQPVDSLSSSPLSPSMSNSRTSTTSDSISERSIPSSSISKLASTTNGRSSKIDSVIPGRRSLTATARSKTSTSSSSTILDAPVTSKSRLSAPKVSQFSSTLPKLVATKSVVNQNTSSPRVQTAASAQCDKSSSLKTSNSSCSKIRQLKQPTGIESVNRAISRVTPIIPASKISNRPKGNGLPKPPVCMGGRLNNLVAVVRPQQQQQQPAQQDDKRGEDVPVTRSNATTKACLSSAEVVVVGRQQELEHEAAARLTSVGAPTTIKLKTTQRRGSSGSKREEDHGAKNEAANLNHKDVNSPTEAAAVTALEAKEGLEEGEAIEEATARTTTTSTVNNQNCLTNNLRDQQDEKERPREKDDEGLVSGHEVVCASKECKQDEDGRGESCLGSGEDVSERTTSGCNGQNGPKKIRPDILVSISPSASSSPRPLVTVPTMAISLEPSSSSLLPPPSSVRGNKSTPASETKSLTTKKNDKDGQNGGVPATDSQIASSSAGSSGGGGKLSDIKQHEKRLEQQINKCLSSQHAHTRMPKLQQKQHDDDLANSNKCLHNNKMGKRGSNLQQPPPRSLDSRSAGKHEIGSDSLCSKSTIRSTRAAAASSSATTTNLCGLVSGMDAHSISASHVVSKPMGHRVLSLMMLDAGLVPAGRDQPTNETRKSHVCLQSEPLTLEQPNRLIEFPSHINDLGDNNNNDADLDIEHETSKSNAPSSQMITNRVDANNCIENTNLYLDELALNCGFDQPRNQANCIETSIEQTRAAARLERFSLFGFQSESIVRGASISLPSSPRLPRASQRRAGANDPSQQQRLQPPASDRKFEHLDLDHAQLINERKSYQRATERWYSPVRKCSVTTTTSEPASTKTNLTCDDNNRRLEIHSATSSCSSLNSHCPPMLSLSNQLDAMEFSRMIKANVDRVSRSWAANRDQHQQQNHEIRLVSAAASTIPLEVNDSKTEVFQSRSQLEIRPQPQQSSSPDRTEQIHKLPYQRPLLLCDESDLTCDGSKDNLSSKIDRLDALRRATEKMRASGFNESELESSGNNRSTHQLGLDKECSIGSPPPANTTRQAVSSNADEIKMLDQQSGLLKLEPRPSGRQPRSNSIGGQEFHHLGGEYHSQRLKQQTHALHSRFVDSNQFYNQKVRDYGGSSQYNHNITADRSISPSGLTSGGGRPADFYVPKRSSSIKYPLDKQQPLARNQIHASLECLNTIYSDYGQQNQKQQSLSNHHPRQYTQHLHLQQQQHQQQQPFKHRPSFQSNHYANTYVLSAAPTDTIVNQSAEQDLAAAAMASPQHYQPILSSGGGSISSSKMDGSMSQSPQSHSHYLAQGSFNNRSTVPISHSPLHRRIVPGPMASILNQITSSTSNPLRAGHSSLSLASSTYLIEDKLQNEIKQLQSELKSEKEKNEALSSQLNINSNLMAAFEQSLTTLNSRLRQVTAISERKDRELELLRSQLDSSNRLAVVESSCETSEKSTSPINGPQNGNLDHDAAAVHLSKSHATSQPVDKNGVDDQTGARDEQTLLKIIEDLKRQLIEKDRLLTDTRLEALSAAHQLEQLESRMNGEQSMMANEDDLDEGVMVVNHSPSDSDAITDSAHFGDQHNTLSHRSSHYDHSNHSADHHHHQQSQPMQAHQHKSQKDCNNSLEDMILFTPTQGHKTTSSESRAGGGGGLSGTSSNQSNDDTHEMMHLHRKQRQLDSHSDQSSSDYHDDDKSPGDMTSQQQEFGARNNGTAGQTFEAHDGKTMNKMLDKLLVSN